MKIGLITGEYPPMQGGVGDFSRELAAALADLGHAVHVVTRVECKTDDGQRTANEKVRVHPIVSSWGWRSFGQVMGLARRLELDVLNVQYQAAAYDLHPAINFMPWRAGFPFVGRTRSPPIVVTFHDLKYPYLFPKAGRLRDWVVTLLARHADAAIVTNRADELALSARRIGRAPRVARIPIGSNIAPALHADYDRNAWRAQLGLEPQDTLLGFFGFFNARKGLETLVRALSLLRQAESPSPESPNYALLFIGGTVGSSDATNQAYAERVKALIAGSGLVDRVHYTGFVPDAAVSAAFAAIDLCVLPFVDGVSFHHGSLMAALAHGCPIVTTLPRVDLPEFVFGKNVWLVPPEDPDVLASAIGTLATDRAGRERLARGAAELALEFAWGRIAARTVELFQKVRKTSHHRSRYQT